MSGALWEALLETVRLWRNSSYPVRRAAEEAALRENPFFSPETIRYRLDTRLHDLELEALRRWLGPELVSDPARVLLLHPGNLPMVGLEDLLATLLVGHEAWSRPSRRDRALLVAFCEDWRRRFPELPLRWVEELEPAMSSVDGLIASGSDQTASWVRALARRAGLSPERLLVRGHRFGVAWSTSDWDEADFLGLAHDVWLYEGHGCRSVSLVWAPAGLDPERLWRAYAEFRRRFPPSEALLKELRSERALYEALRPWLGKSWSDPGGVLSVGPPEPLRPGHLRWAVYESPQEVLDWLECHRSRLQVVIARSEPPPGWEGLWARPGEAQCPALDWRPDGRDTVAFLRMLRPRAQQAA